MSQSDLHITSRTLTIIWAFTAEYDHAILTGLLIES